MNMTKEILNYELNFLSNRIPYIKTNNWDQKSKYFCIYRCYFNDIIKIYKVEPNCITIINIKDNIVTDSSFNVSGKIKPILCIDQQSGRLYFLIKEKNSYHICSCSKAPQKDIEYYVSKNGKIHFQNYCSKLLVNNKNIFIVQQKKIAKWYPTKIKTSAKSDIIAASCDANNLVILAVDQLIRFYDIDSLKLKSQLNLSCEHFFSDSAYLFVNNSLYIYFVNNKFIVNMKLLNVDSNIEANANVDMEKGQLVSIYNFNAIQEINQNFIDKYMGKKNSYLELSAKYKEMLSFVSEINFPDDSYEGDILFFGPSIYLPLKKNADNSLYSKLNKIKNEDSFSNGIMKKLSNYSKNGDLEKLKSNTKKILRDCEEEDIDLDEKEIDYFLNVIRLPESINEEAIVPSSLMPSFFNFIVAEIINTFINLLIIRGLKSESIDGLDEAINVYSSLYRIISSDLVKYNTPSKGDDKESNEEDDDDDDGDNGGDDDDDDNGGSDDDDNDIESNISESGKNKPINNTESFIQSKLYILNSSFSPLSLREQLWFLYKGNTTFSKLSKDDILAFNAICPEPYVEQRALDVAKAYLESDDYDNCLEYLKKINMDSEDLEPIQNVYISHLLKHFPEDFEKQFQLLRMFKKRLPKNMYKSLYIISLKANQFSTAVEEFYSKNALENFAREVNKNKDLYNQYQDIIVEVLKEKQLIIELISKQ